MQFNVAQREITLKVVYYGPPFCGKTTNLHALHSLLAKDSCGRLTILDTADDRTLFFDLLPVVVNSQSGYRIKLKLFTVPGQVVHAATRRVVLAGADGVIFVADSQLEETKNNQEYWQGMREHLSEGGIDPDAIPTVVQFNKRDLPNVRSDAELDEIRARGKHAIYPAVAVEGTGVCETLRGLLSLLFAHLDAEHGFQKKFRISTEEFLNAVFIGTNAPEQAHGAAGAPL